MQYLSVLECLEAEVLGFQKRDNNSHQTILIRCLLYDNLGCGQSPPVEPHDKLAYTDCQQVSDLHALLESQLETTTQPTFLIAHSYGPMIALKYIQEYPITTLEGIILLSTGFSDGPIPLYDGGPRLFQLPLMILNCLQSMLTESFLKLGFSKTSHRDNPNLLERSRHDCNRNPMHVVQAYYAAHSWLSSIQASATVGNTPCFVLHGADDQIIPVASGQFVANQLGSSLNVVDHAGHMILVEQPQPVAKILLEFVIRCLFQ